MCGEAVTQRVGMDLFLDARALDSLLASVPGCFRIDGLITVVATVAYNHSVGNQQNANSARRETVSPKEIQERAGANTRRRDRQPN
jgi:hypothetical protein